MEISQFIDQLDLNSYEKEVFLYLTTIDNADAKKIYQNTKVPKGRIYSVLNSLIEKNFVNIIPTSPKKYKIENIKNTLKNYLKTKQQSINQQIKDINSIKLKPKTFPLEKNAPSVYSFAGREEHINALILLRNNAKKRIINIAPIFKGTFASNLSIYNAIKRGVDLRVITRKITKENKKNIKECLKLGAKVRYIDSPQIINFIINDKNELVLGLDDYRNKEESLNVYSKNKGLLLVLENYFENMWQTAHKINIKKL